MNTNKLLAITAAALCSVAGAADTNTKTFGWMAGHWCGEQGGAHIEELWLDARAEPMIGLSRTLKDGKTRNFEYMRIERDGDTVTFIAQPQGSPPVPFKWTAGGGDWARFTNPAHDFPNRVEYRRTPTGLHAEIAGPGKDGKEFVIPFDYIPCKL